MTVTTDATTIPAHLLDLDARDLLAHKRAEFLLPPDVLYLDGNSLGPLHRSVPARLAGVAEREWGQQLIRSWMGDADWMHLPERVAAKLARLIGAQPDEVAVGDSTTVNVFKALAAALHLAPQGRRVILTDADNFPTDLYVAQGLNALLGGGYELRRVPNTEVADHLNADVAVLLLTEVDYRTGRRLDLPDLTARAHAAGVLTIWDLAHSAGAFPVDLDGAGADFAVGCGYKFLNGGPGAPGYLYVAARHLDRAPVAISGWMGHADVFEMAREYSPAPGARRFVPGTPQVLGLSALDSALDAFADVEMADLRAKSLSLTSTFMALMELLAARHPLELVTPTEPEQRGSQVSYRHPDARGVMARLTERGIIGDFRTPDILRFGITPLYHSHADMWRAVQGIGAVLDRAETPV
ncbi:kynureninase [Deinococcus metalli]|uniref:Kynureninase n=1 Tax=Deinococcus metalli TaxID=1141878 RepID=A0A7W8KCG8_9DEIO|nr:kynureninase [Deinococcus metalli]MBB5375655.1 kynureninase [Deinococcus metalli]GHF38041.1 kynureninase [Deinococcus metalli]